MGVKVTIPNNSSDSVVFGSANTAIAAEVKGVDNGSTNGSLVFNTTASGTSTERMRIDSSGNVGIGTSSPGTRLQINGNILNVGGNIFTDTTSGIFFSGANNSFTNGVYGIGINNIAFNTASSERMRIDSSGNVGIGTTSINARLSVVGTAGSSTVRYSGRSSDNSSTVDFYSNDNATRYGFQYYDSTVAQYYTSASIPMAFGTGGAERMRISAAGGFSVGTTADPGAGAIYATGNITAYYSSDRRLKENIKDVDGALEKVCAIGSKTFDWTDEYIASKGGEDGYFVQKSDFGVVAQDVQEVFPQAVRTREDGTLAVDYEKLATLAFGAIKELVKRVEALEVK